MKNYKNRKTEEQLNNFDEYNHKKSILLSNLFWMNQVAHPLILLVNNG